MDRPHLARGRRHPRRAARRAGRRAPGGHPPPGAGRTGPPLADAPRRTARPGRLVADAGLVYDLLVKPHQLPAAVEAARRLPRLAFVLDHLAKPPVTSGELEPWAGEIRRLAALPNTVCKLSGLVTEADWDTWRVADLQPYAATVLDAFGPDRLMFGSDRPVCRLAADYREVLDTAGTLVSGLSPAEHRDVFAGCAVRTYGLRI
ncbi:amidohydrolase family protein [Streptomyces ossamyceticus]|nr:amidohydrolase family protein [Streptomyces ossamyceticus]